MCLSTIYRNEKQDENILCRFVESIQVDGSKLTFPDVMGAVTEVSGRLVRADLTSGTIIIAAD